MKVSTILILAMSLWPKIGLSLTNQEQMMLKEHGVNSKQIMLQTDKWGVKPSQIDIDSYSFKGQSRSLIDWKMDHKDWLDFEYWKEQRDAKDKLPKWKIALREIQNSELIGQVIKCYGICNVYRGQFKASADYMSRIYEGDELITGENSYVWVMATDGSLLRVSPKTSITFNEVNIGVQDIYYYTRLNFGHVHWQVRKTGTFEEQNLAETDMIFYPLMLKEVNREYFAIQENKKMDHDQRLMYQTRKNPGHVSQYEQLNQYMLKNKEELTKKNIHVFMVALNSTYHIQNAHFDLYYATNSDAKFRFFEQIDGFRNEDKRESKVLGYLRGYNNSTEKVLQENQWYKVSNEGKSFKEEDLEQQFKTISLFIKRVPTIHLARELMLRSTFSHMLDKNQTAEKLAKNYGYRLWDQDRKEFKNRLEFLKEYTRRVETTNAHSTQKIFKGKKLEDFDVTYYARALDQQIIKLKSLYSRKYAVIPELNELQYYIWILKYAKKQ